MSTVPALELRDLRKSFGKTEIIRGASLSVQPGERVAIIGPNGAGKSTLFNLISGRFAPTSGEVVLLRGTTAECGVGAWGAALLTGCPTP